MKLCTGSAPLCQYNENNGRARDIPDNRGAINVFIDGRAGRILSLLVEPARMPPA